ncbi:MAG: hypothetical protein ACK56I_26420, partial [bacterium]
MIRHGGARAIVRLPRDAAANDTGVGIHRHRVFSTIGAEFEEAVDDGESRPLRAPGLLRVGIIVDNVVDGLDIRQVVGERAAF